MRNLAQTLCLPQHELNGTIVDFVEAFELIERLQDCEHDGVEVLWDPTSTRTIRVLGAVTNQNVSVGISRKRDWFQLEGECILDGHSVSISDLLEAVHASGGKLPGNFIRIGDQGEIEYAGEIEGDTVADVLSYVEYDAAGLVGRFRQTAEEAVRAGRISPQERRDIMAAYAAGLRGYTYYES